MSLQLSPSMLHQPKVFNKPNSQPTSIIREETFRSISVLGFPFQIFHRGVRSSQNCHSHWMQLWKFQSLHTHERWGFLFCFVLVGSVVSTNIYTHRAGSCHHAQTPADISEQGLLINTDRTLKCKVFYLLNNFISCFLWDFLHPYSKDKWTNNCTCPKEICIDLSTYATHYFWYLRELPKTACSKAWGPDAPSLGNVQVNTSSESMAAFGHT